MRQEIEVTIAAPDGFLLDVTDRLSSIDTLSQSLEEDLLEFVHDDISLDLDDSDGTIEGMLQHATATDVYVVVVWRSLERRRGARQLLFAGTLDLPWSIKYDRKDQRVTLQVFAYSKLLERTSAEGVARSVTGRTATVAAASDAVTVSSTTDILAGDTITLENESTSTNESQVVEAVLSGTTLRTVEVWDNDFTDAPLTLDTPYFRNETVEELATLLFLEAGITDYDIQLEQDLSEIPFATSGNDGGLPVEILRSLTIQTGNVSIVGQTSGTQHADTPHDSFTDVDATTTAQIDWRPYLLSEPATIVRAPSTSDVGTYAADHAAGDYYNLVKTPSLPDPTATLTLHRNGGSLATIDTYVAGAGNAGYFPSRCMEIDSINGEAWICYERTNAPARVVTEIVPIPGAGSQTDYDLVAGKLRFCRALSRMFRVVGTSLEVHTVGSGKHLERTVTAPDGLVAWTLRHFDTYVMGISVVGLRIQAHLWDATTFDLLSTIDLVSANEVPFVTVFDEADGTQVAVILLANMFGLHHSYFVLSREFAGVIPYADFEGKSCAAALRDLAMVSFATLTVDEHRTGRLISRDAESGSAPVILPILPTPLTRETLQLTEQYRTSVLVTGKTETGEDIKALGGETGDSQRRLELDSQLITTSSLAQAIAAGYAAYFSRARREEQVTVQEEGDLVRPGDHVVLDGIEYKCISAETDVLENEQQLRLLERLDGDPL